MAENTDFSFLAPSQQEDNGPVKNFFKRLMGQSRGLVGDAPVRVPVKSTVIKPAQAQNGEYISSPNVEGSGLLKSFRERRLKNLFEQGEKEVGINKSAKDAAISLPNYYNKEYVSYMKQPGFVQRLGREMHGPNYVYGSNSEKDAQIKSQYDKMIGNVKDTDVRILNRGFVGEGGHFDAGNNRITMASGHFASDQPTKFHEFSHAMVPSSRELSPEPFYANIPNTVAANAVLGQQEEQKKLGEIRNIVGKNLGLAGIGTGPNAQGEDPSYYIRKALLSPEKNGSSLSNEELMKYYNALPAEKKSVEYNPERYKTQKEESSANYPATDVQSEYLQVPSEVRARATVLRKALINQGFPQNRTYTKDKIEKAIKNKSFNDGNSYKELKESGLSDDQIIHLLNNLAQAPARQGQYQAIQGMA